MYHLLRILHPTRSQVVVCVSILFSIIMSKYCYLNFILVLCVHAAEAFSWTKIEPKGKGPCPRRRQCCCMVGDRIILFGGTR